MNDSSQHSYRQKDEAIKPAEKRIKSLEELNEESEERDRRADK